MSDKERENIGCGFLLGVSLALIVMAAGVACLADLPDRPKDTESKYVVTDTVANKIESYPADSLNVQIAMRDSILHTMHQKQK